MKKDNRGFLLAESLVVSTFVLTVLILLYIQFSNLTTNYKNSYNYNNVESIYDLSSVANYLQTNNYDLSTKLTQALPYVVVYKDGSCNMDAGIIDNFCDNLINKMDAKTIIYTYSDISIIKKYISTKEDNNINQKFRDFISKVETNVVQNKGRLFAEFNNDTYATIAMDNQLYIEETPEENTITVGGVNIPIVTENDGLYADSFETGKYTYKGANPNNYINFSGETWRLISINSDSTLKIMRSQNIANMPWDTEGVSTWNAPATLNTYLNSTYLQTLSEQSQITSHNWPIGTINYNNNDLASQITSENSTNWNGKVGLIAPSEYIRANTNNVECGTASLISTNYNKCINTNWMSSLGTYWWTISHANASFSPIFIHSGGFYYDTDVLSSSRNVVPVVYLNSNITLTGSGTQTDPYKIG